MEDLDDKSIGLDCSIVPSKRYPEFKVVSTTDFFYPLVESPYFQGKIAAANVLSDMYALGIYDIDNVLMILAASRNMKDEHRKICTKQMMKGFNDLCAAADTRVTGGQTVLNPWPIIGGVAKSVVKDCDFIDPKKAEVGDVIVLTKPLGTQVAVNFREWTYSEEKWNSVKEQLGNLKSQLKSEDGQAEKEAKEEVERDDHDDKLFRNAAARAFRVAGASMERLNRTGAKLMHTYQAHGATDVTGFGILGHASNLAQAQENDVHFLIDKLPIIKHMDKVADVFKFFHLKEGYSAETSGGLLVLLPEENAQDFIDNIEEEDGWPAWVIGKVVDANQHNLKSKAASIANDVAVVEV